MVSDRDLPGLMWQVQGGFSSPLFEYFRYSRAIGAHSLQNREAARSRPLVHCVSEFRNFTLTCGRCAGPGWRRGQRERRVLRLRGHLGDLGWTSAPQMIFLPLVAASVPGLMCRKRGVDDFWCLVDGELSAALNACGITVVDCTTRIARHKTGLALPWPHIFSMVMVRLLFQGWTFFHRRCVHLRLPSGTAHFLPQARYLSFVTPWCKLVWQWLCAGLQLFTECLSTKPSPCASRVRMLKPHRQP